MAGLRVAAISAQQEAAECGEGARAGKPQLAADAAMAAWRSARDACERSLRAAEERQSKHLAEVTGLINACNAAFPPEVLQVLKSGVLSIGPVAGQAVVTPAHLLGLLDAHISQRPPATMVEAMALYVKALKPLHTISCREAHGQWQLKLAALEGVVRHLDKQVGIFTPQVVDRLIIDVLRKPLSHAAQSSSLMLQLVAGVGNGQLDSGSLGSSASFALAFPNPNPNPDGCPDGCTEGRPVGCVVGCPVGCADG